jgi:phospholipid/cholesterol/gamma-HCH transport system substrate-binding protein
MMAPGEAHEGGLSVRDQIERYRTAFIAVVVMVVIAAGTAGYILAHENLKLPGWVPFLGKDFYTLKAEFQTAQAVTPGQGQSVTIAGAKIGEIATVDLEHGVATVTMRLIPKYARIYRNATILLRPKTGLQDMVVEVSPGTPSAGRIPSGGTIPISQTAPNIDFDEFLAALDTETRAYLQELLAGLGEGFKNNGRATAATFKRFDPTARDVELIAKELERRHAETARSIHNFRLLMEALGGKDKQIAELVDAANAVFATFAKEDASVEKTLHLLPGVLKKTGSAFGKVTTASNVVAPTLHKLVPFANALGPANEATKRLAEETTPVFKNEIRPFAREILPVVNKLGPSTKELGEAFPTLATSFSVLNEFFNELGYNPGASQASFGFFAAWGAHDANSILSSADAHGILGRSLVYFNCNVVPLFAPVAKVNPTVNLIVGLLNPPNAAACKSAGVPATALTAASLKTNKRPAGVSAPGGVFSELGDHVFGRGTVAFAQPSAAGAGGGGR